MNTIGSTRILRKASESNQKIRFEPIGCVKLSGGWNWHPFFKKCANFLDRKRKTCAYYWNLRAYVRLDRVAGIAAAFGPNGTQDRKRSINDSPERIILAGHYSKPAQVSHNLGTELPERLPARLSGGCGAEGCWQSDPR